MNNNIYEEEAKEIFKKANVSLDTPRAREFFEEITYILQNRMAMLSSTMGLSFERVKAYDEQKETLVDDLKKLLINHPDELKQLKGEQNEN